MPPDRTWLCAQGIVALFAMLFEFVRPWAAIAAIVVGALIGTIAVVILVWCRGPNIPDERVALIARGSRRLFATAVVACVSLFILGAGPVSGQREAVRRIEQAQGGFGWDYRLRSGMLHGIPVVANPDRIWILAREGLRQVRVDDIAGISLRPFIAAPARPGRTGRVGA